MALEWQKLNLDASKGANLGVDERVLAPGSFLVADNIVWDKAGAMSKRPGTVRIGGPAGETKRLFSNGRELCALTKDRLYAYVEEAHTTSGTQAKVWTDRGYVGRYVGKQRECWRDSRSVIGTDSYVDTQAGQVVFVGCSTSGQDIASAGGGATAVPMNWNIDAAVYGLDGQALLPKQELTGGSYTTVYNNSVAHAARAFGCGVAAARKLGAAYMAKDGTTAEGDVDFGTIHAWFCAGTNVDAGFVQDLTNWPIIDAFHDSGRFNARTYDIIPVYGSATGEYYVAYIQVDRTAPGGGGRPARDRIILQRRRATDHSVLATSYIQVPVEGDKWKRVALNHDAAVGYLYVTCVNVPAAGGEVLYAYARDMSTLAAQWGGTALEVNSVGATFDNIGSIAYSDGAGGLFLVTVYGDANVASAQWSLNVAWCKSDDGTAARAGVVQRNMWPLSRPTLARAQHATDTDAPNIVVAATTMSANYLYDSHQLIEFQIHDAADNLHSVDWHWAGMWDCGRGAMTVNEFTFYLGSLQNLMHDAQTIASRNGSYWLASSARDMTVLGDTIGAPDNGHRFLGSITQLYTYRAPWVAGLPGGTAMIGGARVYCYDGEKTYPHGYSHPPVISAYTTGGTGSGITPIRCTATAIYEMYDSNGCLMRSMPTKEEYVTLNEASEYANFSFRTIHQNEFPKDASPREYRYTSIVPFVADSNGTMRRYYQPRQYLRNDWLVFSTSSLTVPPGGMTFPYPTTLVAQSSPPLYTESGEIESAPVEGAEFVVVANERVWLGGMFHRDRICYSKRFTAGAGGTVFILPEFNEGFGMSIPSGKDCTGIAALDDKVLVFTEDEVYAIVGRGPADDGSDNDLSGMTLLSDKHGCVASDSIVTFRDGVAFLSRDSMLLVGHDLSIKDIGAQMRDYWPGSQWTTQWDIKAAGVWPEKNLALWSVCPAGADAYDSVMLAYDYATGNWSKWQSDITNALRPILGGCGYVFGMAVHAGKFYTAQGRTAATSYDVNNDVWYFDTLTGAYAYDYDPSGYSAWIKFKVRTPWLQLAGPIGWKRVRDARFLLGFVSGSRTITANVYSDFQTGATQTHTWTNAELAALAESSRMDLALKPIRQKCQAISLEVTDDQHSTTAGDLKLHGITLEWAPKGGLAKADAGRKE